MYKNGWFNNQIKKAESEVDTWPEWMKEKVNKINTPQNNAPSQEDRTVDCRANQDENV